MVEIIIVLAVIAVLAAVFLPAIARPRMRSKRIGCTNLLKQVGLAFRLWSGDNGDKYPMQISVKSNGVMELIEAGYVSSAFLVMSNELSTPRILWCPSDTRNRMASTFASGLTNSNVNYFVGLDADETRPQMFLSGDDNLNVAGLPVKSGIIALSTNMNVTWSTNRHNLQGNVGLADGSVQGFTSKGLMTALNETGTNVIRLAFP